MPPSLSLAVGISFGVVFAHDQNSRPCAQLCWWRRLPRWFPFCLCCAGLCGCTLGWSQVSVGSGEKLTFSLTHTNSRVLCARVCVRFSSCFSFRVICVTFSRFASSSSFHLTGTHKEQILLRHTGGPFPAGPWHLVQRWNRFRRDVPGSIEAG